MRKRFFSNRSYLSFLFAAALLGGFLFIPSAHASAPELYSTSLFSDANLQAYYQLENASDSKNSYNLTTVGSVAFNPAMFNNGADLGSGNSGNALERTADSLGIVTNNESTRWYHFWIKMYSVPLNVSSGVCSNAPWVLIEAASSGGYVDEWFYGEVNGNYVICDSQYNGSSGYQGTGNISSPLSTSTFSMVDIVQDGAAASVYINTVLQSTSTTPAPDGNSGLGPIYAIGADAINSKWWVPGIFDDFAVFNIAPTTADLDELYSGAPSSTPPTLASSSLEQYESDGITTLVTGASTTSQTAVLKGVPESSSSDPLVVQFEAQPYNMAFSGTPNATSGVVTSGEVASATISDMLYGPYHWQARAFDTSTTAASSWEQFDSSSTLAFTIINPSMVEISDGSVNHLYNMTQAACSSGTLCDFAGSWNMPAVGSGSVNYSPSYSGIANSVSGAAVSDEGWRTSSAFDLSSNFSVSEWFNVSSMSNGVWYLWGLVNPSGFGMSLDVSWDGSTGLLESQDFNCGINNNVVNASIGDGFLTGWHNVTIVHTGSTKTDQIYFDGSPTITNAMTGGTGCGLYNETDINAPFSTGGGSTNSGTMYFNQIFTTDDLLATSTISAIFNEGTGQAVCITVGCGDEAPWLSSLDQYKSDATTTINEGSSTTDNTIIFGAQLNSSGTSTLQLQVEVEPTSTGFTDVPNVTSSATTSPGNYATSTYFLPPESSSDGGYHWQARVIDSNGVTSTWHLFGSNGSSTDFIINTVPLYTQEESPYPSDASTSAWAISLYDNAYPGSQCGNGADSSTIEACGCAISSVSMWMRYYGITTDNSGTDVNPATLNNWLENNSGYDNLNGGILIWSAVDGYASPPGGGTITWDPSSPRYGSTTSELEPYINDFLSSSTPDPVILFESNAPDGSATTTHYVVAVATSTYDGSSTYVVRDSYWYNTQFLNQPTSTGPGTVNFYNNNIDGIEVYYDPPQVPIWGQYDINLPNGLILVDSQGRRTGEDPITGTLYNEIPNTAYG
ncbi:MAG TPA: hypothetical protein VMA75_00005, partial [Candidatus Paceibacterota bacterium]|nr:hypothetical protein [Candidatus Paceibacterota bacterium]